MKKFFWNPDHAVGLLASANLAGAGIITGVEKVIVGIQPFLHFLMTVGQVGVAAVTIYYIWSKTRALTRGGKRKRKR